MWNSLEIAKLVVQALTPITVAVVGYWINYKLKHIEDLQWISHKVTEKRLTIFDEMAPRLNDLLCYFIYVGAWKELTPLEVVKHKRELDKLAYVNQALFSNQFLNKYENFISKCYKTHTGWGVDARLRTHIRRRKEAAKDKWNDEWDAYFTAPSDASDPKEVTKAYAEFMSWFSNELGTNFHLSDIRTGRVPIGVR